MEKLVSIDSIVSQLNPLPFDLRGEFLVSHLIEGGNLSQEQYMVKKAGQFSRSYRYDILDITEVDDDFDTTQFLQLLLSRDSIYDTLPENLLHPVRNDTPEKGVDTMVREYKLQQEQQKQARQFFQPFENELFAFGVVTERFEHQFLTSLNETKTPEMFYDFWGMSRDFPPQLMSKMLKLLPFAYKIVGNIPLSVQILALLLNEKVELKAQDFEQYSDENEAITLGDCRLGVDFITGHSYDDYSCHYQLVVGPLENTHFQEYINNGTYQKFIHLFCEYFFPLEMDIELKILLQNKDEPFEFNAQQQSILGYNTRI